MGCSAYLWFLPRQRQTVRRKYVYGRCPSLEQVSILGSRQARVSLIKSSRSGLIARAEADLPTRAGTSTCGSTQQAMALKPAPSGTPIGPSRSRAASRPTKTMAHAETGAPAKYAARTLHSAHRCQIVCTCQATHACQREFVCRPSIVAPTTNDQWMQNCNLRKGRILTVLWYCQYHSMTPVRPIGLAVPCGSAMVRCAPLAFARCAGVAVTHSCVWHAARDCIPRSTTRIIRGASLATTARSA
jgi:hypothetical protein